MYVSAHDQGPICDYSIWRIDRRDPSVRGR